MKTITKQVLNKKVTIHKMSAHSALRVHAEATKILAPALGELVTGIGEEDDKQAEKLSNAVVNAFSTSDASNDVVNFIEKVLISGDIVIENDRVAHLNDFDAFDDIDGSELMYCVFSEWVIFNLGGLIKKLTENRGG